MKIIELMRPENLYAKIIKQREVDGRSFYKKHDAGFIDVACPACGRQGRPIFKKYGFTHKRCAYCSTLYCSPRPPDRLLEAYYRDFKAAKMWTELLLKADTQRKALQYAPRVEQIISVMRKSGLQRGSLALDFGAGSGAFLLCLKKTGFFKEVMALDHSPECLKACKKSGLKCFSGRIEDLGCQMPELISMNDVIEHIYDPASLLKICFKALKRGGFISIATPNGEGFDFKILKGKTGNITPPEHLNYFNPGSLSLLLKRCGFKVMLVDTCGRLDVEIIAKAKQSGFALKKKNEYLDYLLGRDAGTLEDFQKFLSGHGLSSHMLVLAVKPKGKT